MINKPTVVLGASLKPNRYSHLAVQRLQQYDHPIIAVGLRAGTINDQEVITFEDAFAKAEIDKNTIDTVTLYIGPKHQHQYMDYVVSLQPKRVIFNPGFGYESILILRRLMFR